MGFKNVYKDKQVATILNIKPNALSNHKLRGTIPHDALITFCDHENISLDWLYNGEEEMTKGPKNEANLYLNEDPKIAELLIMTKEVLKSETQYADSLSANVKSFHYSVELEKRVNRMEEDVSTLKEKVDKDTPEINEYLGKKEEALELDINKTEKKYPNAVNYSNTKKYYTKSNCLKVIATRERVLEYPQEFADLLGLKSLAPPFCPGDGLKDPDAHKWLTRRIKKMGYIENIPLCLKSTSGKVIATTATFIYNESKGEYTCLFCYAAAKRKKKKPQKKGLNG